MAVGIGTTPAYLQTCLTPTDVLWRVEEQTWCAQ